MTGEDGKNYRSIVWRRWKEIKEDLARLSTYNDRARQMRDDNLLVSNMEQQTIIERQPKKALKTPEFVESDDSDNEEWDDQEEKKPAIKRTQTLPKKAPKTPDEEPVAKQPPELIETESEGLGYSYLTINLRHDTEKTNQSNVQPGLWYTEVKHYSSR